MGRETSILEVSTAFADCAKKCPEFEMDVNAITSGGGFYEFKTFECIHLERCRLISSAFKEDEK